MSPQTNKTGLFLSWESTDLPEPQGEAADAEDVSKDAVAHGGAADPPGALPARHQASQVDRDGIGPGQLAVLLPPSPHHQRHVKPQQEVQWKLYN